MPFKNFSIWRGRLPHWRADDVTYYVTFRHSRPLEPTECASLMNALLRPDGRKWNLLIACVLPEKSELIFIVLAAPDGRPYELAKVVEQAKAKAGAAITKKSGERFSPFYFESYDRIIRDEVELEARWTEIFESPVKAELVETPEAYPCLWVPPS